MPDEELFKLPAVESIIKNVIEDGDPVLKSEGKSTIYYKDPNKRSMGDIDFLVNEYDYEKAKKVLLNCGYKLSHEEDFRNR